MNKIILKTFYKRKLLKVIFVGEDKRITTHWLLPNEKMISFNEKTYPVIPQKIFYSNGIPTLLVNYKNAEPLDPLEFDNQVYDPSDFNTAISAKVGRDIFLAGEKKPMDIGFLVSILVILVLGYVIYSMMNNQTELLKEIAELNRLLGGGA